MRETAFYRRTAAKCVFTGYGLRRGNFIGKLKGVFHPPVHLLFNPAIH